MRFVPEKRTHFKHVGCLAAALGLGLIANQLPRAYGESLIIPKLGYNPTLKQLLSDYNLQREMLAVDLKATDSAPVFGKGALGFDEKHLDFILAKTANTAGPTTDLLVNVDIDRKLSKGSVPGPDDFSVECDLQLQTQQIASGLDQGTGLGWGDSESLTFPWNIVQTKSYFSQNLANYVFALQIPITYMGSGGPGGQYGFFLAWVEDGEKTFPGYPAVGDGNVPNSWGSFSMAVHESAVRLPTAATLLATPLFLAGWRMERVKRIQILHEASKQQKDCDWPNLEAIR